MQLKVRFVFRASDLCFNSCSALCFPTVMFELILCPICRLIVLSACFSFFFGSVLSLMDPDNVAANVGFEAAHQNGAYVQHPTTEEDSVVSDTFGSESTEIAAPNGNAKIAVELDDGTKNESSTADVKEESNAHSASNGLTIAKVLIIFYSSFYL